MAIISVNINIYTPLAHKLTCVTVLLTHSPVYSEIHQIVCFFLTPLLFTCESSRILRNTLIELLCGDISILTTRWCQI